ncbi:hypothetical protein ACWCPU_31290, partial [Streptomyces anthocyanicus]
MRSSSGRNSSGNNGGSRGGNSGGRGGSSGGRGNHRGAGNNRDDKQGGRPKKPHPELDFENPFQLVVATVLSAQTTDLRVNQT